MLELFMWGYCCSLKYKDLCVSSCVFMGISLWSYQLRFHGICLSIHLNTPTGYTCITSLLVLFCILLSGFFLSQSKTEVNNLGLFQYFTHRYQYFQYPLITQQIAYHKIRRIAHEI